MARKLLCMVALITLVLLAQAAPGLADIYNLSNLGNPTFSTWGETRDGQSVGFAPSTFHAYSYPDGAAWNIPLLDIDAGQSEYIPDGDYAVIVKTVYNALNALVPLGTPLFTASLPGGTVINSYDTVITLTAKYRKENSWDIYPSNSSQYTIITDGGQLTKFAMEGSGTSDGTPFTFLATMVEMTTDHTHQGYIENFSVTTAAHTPIPGAVWLLGTGLLGLGCVGWRRRRA